MFAGPIHDAEPLEGHDAAARVVSSPRAALQAATGAWLVHFLRERASEACGLGDEIEQETWELIEELWRDIPWIAIDRALVLCEDQHLEHLAPRLAVYELLGGYLVRRRAWARRVASTDHHASALRVLRDDLVWAWVLEAATHLGLGDTLRVNRARVAAEAALAAECRGGVGPRAGEVLAEFIERELLRVRFVAPAAARVSEADDRAVA